MDYDRLKFESDFLRMGELDVIAADCRLMANKLGLIISWRVRNRTATAILKYNGLVLWKDSFTEAFPHRMLCLMYMGIQTELRKREKENRDSALRMKQIEEERNRERQVMNMPAWSEKRKG